MFSLKNKHTVITGGGSGIGQAIAVLFAKQGAIVHIIELSEESAKNTLHEINSAGGEAYALAADVSNQHRVDVAFAALNRVDVLVNNAGIAHIGNASNTSEADFDRVYNVNVKGAYNTLHAVIPKMQAQGGGVILNMASIAATLGLSDRFAYSMSKGAILAMTLSVARDYIQNNIRCNCISPARVHTPLWMDLLQRIMQEKKLRYLKKLSKSQPIGRMAKPEEVAALALYLCSDEAGFVTGTDYPLDGGFTRLNT